MTRAARRMARLIERLTEPGDTVLYPFTGSGTTGVACAYADIARRRIADAVPLGACA